MSGDIFDIDQGDRETITGTLHDLGATTGDVLTVQADGSIAAAPGGGGGGGVTVVTKRVSSAQILDLFNTPVVLVPGVPGSVITVLSVFIAYIAGTTPYLDRGGALNVLTGSAFTWVAITTAGVWDQATDQFNDSPVVGNGGATVDADGVDVVLNHDTANATLGNGVLAVTLAYFLAYTSG